MFILIMIHFQPQYHSFFKILIPHSDHNIDFITGGLKVEVTLFWARSLIEVFPDSDSCIYVINGIHQNSDGNLIATSSNCFYSTLFTSNNFFWFLFWFLLVYKKAYLHFFKFSKYYGMVWVNIKTFWDFQNTKASFFLNIRWLESANISTEIANQQHRCSRMQFVLTFKQLLKQLSQFTKIFRTYFLIL